MSALCHTPANGLQLCRASLARPCVRPRQAFAFPVVSRSRAVAVRAASEDPDAEFDKRIEAMMKAKGATPYGEGAKSDKGKKKPEPAASPAKASKPVYDYTAEKLHWEGGPATSDLVFNLALGTTLLWLPLTIAAVTRAAFVKYKFTDMRFSVTTAAPWQSEQTDVAYQEVKEVVTVSRAFGLWGDMVVTLKDNSKVELRSLDKFLELKKYVLERRDALVGKSTDLNPQELLSGQSSGGKKGFS